MPNDLAVQENPFLAVPVQDLLDIRPDIEAAAARVQARYDAEMAPLRDKLAKIDEAVILGALAIKATRLPSENYGSVELVRAQEEVWSEARLYMELRELRINGQPIPEDDLKGASYKKEPKPQPPEFGKHKTRLDKLAERYGDPVRTVIDRCREHRYGAWRVSYKPLPPKPIDALVETPE